MGLTQSNGTNNTGLSRQPSRNSKVTAVLVLAILALGSIAVYQQFQISNLSSSLAKQSSEFANPTSSVTIADFTVSMLNVTAKPVLYLVFRNNGTTPASSLQSLLVGVYGTNNNFQSCYNSTQNYFPLYSNESVMVVSSLSCGELGNNVVLTATVDFLTGHGTTTKVYSARTMIVQSQFSIPAETVVSHIGIKTYVVPEIAGGGTIYDWVLVVTNESPTPIVSINETALTIHGNTFNHEGCVIRGAGVSKTSPLSPNYACQIQNNIPLAFGPFKLGERLQITVGVEFLNGSSIFATTTATVIPFYVFYQ